VTVAVSALATSSSGTTKETTVSNSFTTTAPSRNKQCVIVGGGPVGLATALTLARPPHSYQVTVLEQTAGATNVKQYDPTRSYLYNINPRGLDWFEEHDCTTRTAAAPASAMKKLVRAGSAPKDGMGSIVIVPADPATPIPPPKQVSISGQIKLTNRTNYWIPRHQMVELLLECCEEHNHEQQLADNTDTAAVDSMSTTIQVHTGKRVDSIVPAENDILLVHCKDGSVFAGCLVVAADGIDSAVRSILANDTTTTINATSWLQSKPKSFQLKQYKSPSTGLKLKALQFPPNFTVPDTDGSLVSFASTTIVAMRGANKGRRDTLSLGMLPMKDPGMVRPANTNTPYDHEIWSLPTGAQAKAWFTKTFPRLAWDRLVDDAEWERFAQAKGTTFPHCQYSPGSAVASPDGMSGVVMVGDACTWDRLSKENVVCTSVQ
jgi:kynurenine 3-monooxygenase